MILSKEEIFSLQELERGSQKYYQKRESLEKLSPLFTGGVLKRLVAVPFPPKLLGGDWQLAWAVGRCDSFEEIKRDLIGKIPYLFEIIYNYTIPSGIGHNLAFFFYTRDYPREEKIFKEMVGCQIFKGTLTKYSFPLRFSLSTEEKEILKLLLHSADLRSDLTLLLSDERKRTKLEVMLQDENGEFGFLRLLPEIDWSKVDNFLHCHFLLAKPEGLTQVELDLTNFVQLFQSYEEWQGQGEIKGVVFYKKNEPLNYWAEELISSLP